MRRRLRFQSALVGLTAVAATACGAGGGGTPAEQLAAALDELASEDFAWELELEASAGAMADAGQESDLLAGMSQFITGFRVGGMRVGDDAEFGVRVMGADVVQMRFIDGSKGFAKFEIAGLLGFAGIDGPSMLADLQAQGLAPNLQALAAAAINSEWIALDIDLDEVSGMAASATGSGADAEAAYDALKGLIEDPASVLEQIGEVTEAEDAGGDGTVFDVTINTRAAMTYLFDEVAPALAGNLGPDAAADLADARAEMEASLADMPETIPGMRVTVVDGKVTRLVIDIDEIARAADDAYPDGEEAALVFSFDRQGLTSIEEPTVSATLTAEDLNNLMGLAQMAM